VKLDQITAKQFDKTIDLLNVSQPDAESALEISVLAELLEDSKVCGIISRDSMRLLQTARRVGDGQERRTLAAVFCSGLRYGWHFRRLIEEQEQLTGLLGEKELERLKQEIAESTR
jgi:hypothetical protein